MGLYAQPNNYTCGPFALKHALVTLGRLADERSISAVAHPHWFAGTDEVKLARAARSFDCELHTIRRNDPSRAHTSLTRHIAQRVPVLLCVDDWGHWVTVVRYESDRFVVLDSKTTPVLQVLTWAQLRSRWEYRNYDASGRSVYDLNPVKPLFRVANSAQFSVERVRFLRRPENRDLALHWDDYLGDLLEICSTVSSRALDAQPMSRFLLKHQDFLVGRLTYWHGEVSRDQVIRLLRNFRFVAETYDLMIRASAKERALTDLAMLLGMWAAAARGVDDMYGSDELCS